MFRFLIAIALVLPVAAHAEVTAEQQRLHECAMKGLVFQMAATFRDSGWSAQNTFAYLKGAKEHGKYDGADMDFIKKAVNLVYFDSNFAYARGDALSLQVIQACAHPTQSQPIQ